MSFKVKLVVGKYRLVLASVPGGMPPVEMGIADRYGRTPWTMVDTLNMSSVFQEFTTLLARGVPDW